MTPGIYPLLGIRKNKQSILSYKILQCFTMFTNFTVNISKRHINDKLKINISMLYC